MPQERLSLATIHETVAGGIGRAFDHELKKIIADCHDRPALEKPREVVLRVKVIPRHVVGADNMCRLESCDVALDVNSRMPVKAAVAYSMKASPDGELIFATESPEDPNQLDLNDAIREQARAGIAPPSLKISKQA